MAVRGSFNVGSVVSCGLLEAVVVQRCRQFVDCSRFADGDGLMQAGFS